jgi:hypothetical protein
MAQGRAKPIAGLCILVYNTLFLSKKEKANFIFKTDKKRLIAKLRFCINTKLINPTSLFKIRNCK